MRQSLRTTCVRRGTERGLKKATLALGNIMFRGQSAPSADGGIVGNDCRPVSSSLSLDRCLPFFSPNPVKLFLRANQCSHTSGLQLINETPLILMLSAFSVSSSSSSSYHHIPAPSLLSSSQLCNIFICFNFLWLIFIAAGETVFAPRLKMAPTLVRFAQTILQKQLQCHHSCAEGINPSKIFKRKTNHFLVVAVKCSCVQCAKLSLFVVSSLVLTWLP